MQDLESLPRWKLEHIAAFLEYSLRHVRDNLAHRQDFPRPIIRVGNRRFWKPADVIEWASKS